MKRVSLWVFPALSLLPLRYIWAIISWGEWERHHYYDTACSSRSRCTFIAGLSSYWLMLGSAAQIKAGGIISNILNVHIHVCTGTDRQINVQKKCSGGSTKNYISLNCFWKSEAKMGTTWSFLCGCLWEMIAGREGYIIVEFAVYGRQMCYCESVVMWRELVWEEDRPLRQTHTVMHNFFLALERVHRLTHTHTQRGK